MSMQDKQMEPVYCVKCQQFFGNPSNLNMCSKCFKDHTKLNQSVQQNKQQFNDISENLLNKINEQIQITSEEPKQNEEKNQEKPNDPSKCYLCDRKVGFLGIDCKCLKTFCKIHKMPEDHNCTFDFKKQGKEIIAQQNPLRKKSQIEEI